MLKRKIYIILLICCLCFLLVGCKKYRERSISVKVNKNIELDLSNEEYVEIGELFSGESNFEEIDVKSIKLNFAIEEKKLIKLSLDNKVKEGSIQVELYDSNNEVYLNIIKKEFKEELYFKLFKGKYILKISVKDGKDGYYKYRICGIELTDKNSNN